MSKRDKIQSHFSYDQVSNLINKGLISDALAKIKAAIAAGKSLCQKVIDWLRDESQVNDEAKTIYASVVPAAA